MKKYLGSEITVFAAIIIPIFLCFPPAFGFFAMCSKISVATVFLTLGGVGCSVIWGLYTKKYINQLYSWGIFQKKAVKVITLFSKNSIILYDKCKSCGIGFYTHGVFNSQIGTKVFFIFLSYDVFNEKFRSKINLWKPTETRIKVKFSKRLYEYLLTVLPRKQSLMLQNDYKKYCKAEDGSLS